MGASKKRSLPFDLHLSGLNQQLKLQAGANAKRRHSQRDRTHARNEIQMLMSFIACRSFGSGWYVSPFKVGRKWGWTNGLLEASALNPDGMTNHSESPLSKFKNGFATVENISAQTLCMFGSSINLSFDTFCDRPSQKQLEEEFIDNCVSSCFDRIKPWRLKECTSPPLKPYAWAKWHEWPSFGSGREVA